MKSHYLLDLLRQHSRVIIPNFGAFLLKVKPQSDSDTDLHITFNDFLKFNDGLLIDHVSQTENIDKYEAEHQVKEYVSKIQYSLIDKGTFEVEGMGTIYKVEKGGLKFTPLGSDLIQAKPTEKPDEEKQTSKTGLSPLMTGKEDLKEEATEKKMEKSNFEIPKKESAAAPVEKPQTKTVTTTVTKTTAQPAKPTKPPQKKKKLLPIWRHILIIVAVLLIVAIILYLAGFFDSPKNIVGDSKNQMAQTSIPEGDEPVEQPSVNDHSSEGTASEVTQDDQQQPAEASNIQAKSDNSKAATTQAGNLNDTQSGSNTTTQPQKTRAGSNVANTQNTKNATPAQSQSGSSSEVKPFHIIAGSFNDKGNAYNFVLKLRAQGFDSRIVNKHNGFYRVSFNSYPTKAQALSALPDIRKNQNPDAWYLYQN